MSYEKHNEEQQNSKLAGKLNWLRAGVLGANDGIISTAGLVVGVAAAGSSASAILTAGVASVVAGAVSMALGEYVSVSAQRDTEDTLVKLHREAHERDPENERNDILRSLEEIGLRKETALLAVEEMDSDQRLAAHLRVELGLDEEDLTSPWMAAAASAISFITGAVLPLIAAIIAPEGIRIWTIILATLLALVVTGTISARLGDAHRGRAVARLVIGGALALAVTFAIGWLFGTTVGA